MPLIDVSEVLSDPDFATEITVARSTVTIDNHGLGSSTQATVTIVAVVTSASASQLKRVPDFENLNGAISVYSQFALTAGQGSADADIVTWRGRTYTVVMVDDWTEFGNGYTAALCSLRPGNG